MMGLIRKRSDFLQKYSGKIVLFLGVFGVGVGGFEFGFIQGVRHTSPPIVIEKAMFEPDTVAPQDSTSAPPLVSETKTLATQAIDVLPVNCPFVGSRNSDKYHAVGCAVVKRIKPENRVCFTSEEDARSRKYQPGCLRP